MLSSPSSGMGILPNTNQRRAPLRPGLANTERSRPDHLPTNRASPLSWGVLPVGCSFGDSHENHRALTEAKRISKEDERKTSAGQSFRGKVGHWIATCKLTFKPRIPPLNSHTCASLWQWSEEREGTDKKQHFWNFFTTYFAWLLLITFVICSLARNRNFERNHVIFVINMMLWGQCK